MPTEPRYLKPGAITQRVLNPLMTQLTRWGLSVRGSRVLEVRGRKSGDVRSTVVNLLTLDGERYLVSPRGETQWVRNLRAAGTGTLRVGKRSEAFEATEVADADKTTILRAYLERWVRETGQFFEGLKADSPDVEIEAAASSFPVFRLT